MLDQEGVFRGPIGGDDPRYLGSFADLTAIQTAKPVGDDEDFAYSVADATFYAWNTTSTSWEAVNQEAVPVSPTNSLTEVESFGGVNKSLDYGIGTVLSGDGRIEDQKFGRYVNESGGVNSSFSSAETDLRTGKRVLKCEMTVAGKFFEVRGNMSIETFNAQKIKANTKYRIGCWVKIENVVGDTSTGVKVNLLLINSAGVVVDSIGSGYIKAQTDWVRLEGTGTTGATITNCRPELLVYGHQGAATYKADVYFDVNSMVFEEIIETECDSLNEPTKAVSGFEILKTQLIGQLNDTVDSSVNVGTTTNNKIYQTFIPLRTKHAGVYIQRKADVGTFTGDVDVSVVVDNAGDPGVILETKTISNATWGGISVDTDYFVELPCLLTSGSTYGYVITPTTEDDANHIVVTKSSTNTYASGVLTSYDGAAWNTETGDLSFKMVYDGLSSGFFTSQHNKTTQYTFDGALKGLSYDFENKRISRIEHFDYVSNITDCESASIDDIPTSEFIRVHNFFVLQNSAKCMPIWKVDLGMLVKNIRVFSRTNASSSMVSAGDNIQIQYSTDGINFTTFIDWQVDNGDGNSQEKSGYLPDLGQEFFYIKLDTTTATGYVGLDALGLECDMVEENFPVNYKTAVSHQFNIPIENGRAVNRIYYRENKFVFPSLEFTDTSGNYINHIYIPLDTTGATSTSSLTYLQLSDDGFTTYETRSGGADKPDDGDYITITAQDSFDIGLNIKIAKNLLRVQSDTRSIEHQAGFGIGLTTQKKVSSVNEAVAEILTPLTPTFNSLIISNTQLISADYSVSINDLITGKLFIVDTTSAEVVLTLPNIAGIPANSNFYQFMINHVSGTNNVKVKTASGDTFVYGNTYFNLGTHRFSFTIAGTKLVGTGAWGIVRNLTLKSQLLRTTSWAGTNFSSLTAIPFESEGYNSQDEILDWTVGTNPERMTVRTTGTYKISYGIDIESTGGGTRNIIAQLYKNGVVIDHTYVRTGNFGGEDQSLSFIPSYIDLEEDDYIELKVIQTSLTGNIIGTTLNIETRL